ncbi:MAG: hypothetical protein LQ342_007932 [Letrouitia transgressa]|nr:MAG: hypothetical protein LQ342_007932 [Letrouitia transgressa]
MSYSAFVVCLIRLFFVLQYGTTNDPTWSDIPSATISNVELCVGVIAASFPTYKPIFNKVAHGPMFNRWLGSKMPSNPSGSDPIPKRGNTKTTEDIMLATLVKNDKHPIDPNDDQERLFVRPAKTTDVV